MSDELNVSDDYGAGRRPHLAEWYGHRVYPTVSASASATKDQHDGRCPFLSETLATTTPCVKQPNSQGVCTISAESNGTRQDWLVCPYRALDPLLLEAMVKRLYDVDAPQPINIRPAVALANEALRADFLTALRTTPPTRCFVYFQDKLGGEISLPRTTASPELSFDITVIELLPDTTDGEIVTTGRYGVIELQTTDTHGSYRHAVEALRGALNLHPRDFPQQLANNPEWAGRRVEGPNIANVFKRTFYQVAFKFQVTKRDTSVGCVLALPRPVWDSWQPFLGAPELHQHSDGTWRLLDDNQADPADWIYVFDIGEHPEDDGGPAPVSIDLVIGTDAATLSRAALDVAPAKAVEHGEEDAVLTALRRRLRLYVPDLG